MFEISQIEILALRNLALVGHALADKIGGRAGAAQRTLSDTLSDVLNRYEIEAAKAKLTR